ncbi:hypothetical protein K2173_013408 [Erythroxylum novogranatense]|uniref:C2 domain-containing protein n=1 Tax=Erythroxylum novogranatense TaxID=1862640 RepID=A0AAV8SA66_9ROSI|nr:hypothetical protein K2173_013408 [Erythroxylum novogranatense]
MAFLTLEITILSAENLRVNKKPVKKNSFVVVKVDPSNFKSTRAESEGGCSPSWNQKLVMAMPMEARFITFQVLSKVGSAKRVIGSVNVPISDFFGSHNTAEDYARLLSYRLKNEKCDKTGVINVSIKVSDEGRHLNKLRPCSPSSNPVVGLAVGEKKGYDGGVVMGIPVWCASRA